MRWMVRRLVLMMFVLLASGCRGTAGEIAKRFEPENLFTTAHPSDFLRDDTYKHVTFEIIAMSGAFPGADMEWVKNKAVQFCKKPKGVSVVFDEAIQPPLGAVGWDHTKLWSDTDLEAYEKKWAR